jgi:hypothetical protein
MQQNHRHSIEVHKHFSRLFGADGIEAIKTFKLKCLIKMSDEVDNMIVT